jgi:hypothetical protein
VDWLTASDQKNKNLYKFSPMVIINTITPLRRLAMLEIDKLNEFLDKCHATLKEHPQELKEFLNAMYNLTHIALYLGYIRGKEERKSIDPEELFNELFNKFLTDQWKHLDNDRKDFYLNEDFFIRLKCETLDLAERLYPIVKTLYDMEPIDASKPIGRLTFTTRQGEEP